MSRIFLVSILLAGPGLLGSAAAHADELSYSLGHQLGERTARSAWIDVRKRRGCRGAGQLRDALHRSARRIDRSAARHGRGDLVDYARGYLRGMREVLRDVAAACPSQCRTLDAAAQSTTGIVHEQVSRVAGAVPRSIWLRDMPRLGCER
jgi:hypothetical protein